MIVYPYKISKYDPTFSDDTLIARNVLYTHLLFSYLNRVPHSINTYRLLEITSSPVQVVEEIKKLFLNFPEDTLDVNTYDLSNIQISDLLLNSFDAAFALSKDINFLLTESELQNFFLKIYQALKPGAKFLLNYFNYKFFNSVGNEVYGYDSKGLEFTSCLSQESVNSDDKIYNYKEIMQVVGQDEIQIEYLIRNWHYSEIKKCLEAVGFKENCVNNTDFVGARDAHHYTYEK
jgi:hypothetical protein